MILGLKQLVDDSGIIPVSRRSGRRPECEHTTALGGHKPDRFFSRTSCMHLKKLTIRIPRPESDELSENRQSAQTLGIPTLPSMQRHPSIVSSHSVQYCASDLYRCRYTEGISTNRRLDAFVNSSTGDSISSSTTLFTFCGKYISYPTPGVTPRCLAHAVKADIAALCPLKFHGGLPPAPITGGVLVRSGLQMRYIFSQGPPVVDRLQILYLSAIDNPRYRGTEMFSAADIIVSNGGR
ncbi:hypothetical protein C8R44DRAFT_745601 [Mycena epipterygia]|nr:hypothetical protein C8R44DRAFT_745601 [Mycena epipterygia]